MIARIFREANASDFHNLMKEAQSIFGSINIKTYDTTKWLGNKQWHCREYYYQNCDGYLFLLGIRNNDTHRKIFICNIKEILHEYGGNINSMFNYEKFLRVHRIKDRYIIGNYDGENSSTALFLLNQREYY